MTAQKLKETFSLKGQVTDVQLKYDKDGNFRHFGFVGYKNNDEADTALTYFNNTFVGIFILFCSSFNNRFIFDQLKCSPCLSFTSRYQYHTVSKRYGR